MNIEINAQDIAANIAQIKQRIQAGCNKAGRKEEGVRLLLATKTVTAEKIKWAIGAGETLIGENKVQELKQKDDLLGSLDIERHFIGHLQTWKQL